MNRKARQSRVPPAGNRPRYRLSRVAAGPYIARIASGPERETRAVGEIAGAAVSSKAFDKNGSESGARSGHFKRLITYVFHKARSTVEK